MPLSVVLKGLVLHSCPTDSNCLYARYKMNLPVLIVPTLFDQVAAPVLALAACESSYGPCSAAS